MKALTTALSLLLTPALGRLAAEPSAVRTDINPALIYWSAFAILPDVSSQGYLLTNEWRGRALDPQFNERIQSYDHRFKLLEQAAGQKAACDWGYDLSQGPDLLMPGLAKIKHFAQAARLRVRWHLENNRPEAARDELLAAFVLARQASRGGVLIGTLVQFAAENMLTSAIAENWFRFRPETLQQILDGIAAAPARGTIAEGLPAERISFRDWLVQRIEGIQAASGGEPEALQKVQALLHSFMGAGEGDAAQKSRPPTPADILQAAGGTTAGLLRQAKELGAFYDEADMILKLPYIEFAPRIKAFNEKVARHPNLLVHEFFPAFEKARLKEFAIEVRTAMLRAALAYRQSGPAGLAGVADPVSGEPFQFRRLEFAGVDRGFELRSKLSFREVPESLIFLEQDGPAFQLEGRDAGKAVK